MKIRLLLFLVGLAISFALPTFAQQKDVVDPEARQQIEAALMKFDDAFNKHDASAIAALYTPYAIQVGNWSDSDDTVSGQQAIEKTYAAEFASSPVEFAGKLVQVYAIGNQMSAISEWSIGLFKG